jgi:hypothetical protein
LTFECSLRQFNGSFDACTNSGTSCDAAGKASASGLCGFGSGTTEDTGCAEGGDVSGAFERGLDGSSTGGSAGANNITADFLLTANVLAEEDGGSGGCSSRDTTEDGADRYGGRSERSGKCT